MINELMIFFLNRFHFFFCSQGRGVMLQKACIPPLGLVWYMGQAMNSSTLPLERERTGTTSMTSGNLTLGASQLFCLINHANTCIHIFYQSFKLVLFVVFCSLSEYYAFTCLLFSELKNGRSWAGQTGTN